MKPIETTYNNIRFRSRLEARWAVFFDEMGIEWHYEPKSFVLRDGTPYVPDFYLPESETWAEVKPNMAVVNLQHANAWFQSLRWLELDGCEFAAGTPRGLVLLFQIPDRCVQVEKSVAIHPIVQYMEGSVMVNFIQFIRGGAIARTNFFDLECDDERELLQYLNSPRHYRIAPTLGDDDELYEAYRRAKYKRFDGCTSFDTPYSN